jgi:hypothetical protein
MLRSVYSTIATAVALAEQEPDGRRVGPGSKKIVHRREIKVELTRPFRFEPSGLELDDEVAVEPNVIKEQIDIKDLIPHLERNLATGEGEAAAQLQEQIPEMDQETALDLPLVRFAGDGQKIEVVGVFQNLFGQIGVRRRQRPLKIGDGPVSFFLYL